MKRIVAVVLVVGGLAVSGEAHAEGIVLESYVKAKPPDSDRILSPVLDELVAARFVGGYDAVGRRWEREVSRPARTEQGLPADFAAGIDEGQLLWGRGRIDEAIARLAPLVDAALANPAAIAEDQRLRDQVQKALVGLALSYHRKHNAEAAEQMMAEVIRSFPNTAISRASHGPEAAELYDRTLRRLETLGRGTLVVKVKDPRTVVFINERYERIGDLRRSDLPAGDYRVYVRHTREGRVYPARVTAGATTVVEVDWELDSLLHTSPYWMGIVFDSEEQRKRLESAVAAYCARQLGVSGVVVLSIGTDGNRMMLAATRVGLDGTVLRKRSLPLRPEPPMDTLRTLGRYVGADEVAPAPLPAVSTAEGSATWWAGWKWVAAGSAVAAIVASERLVAFDGRCLERPCRGNGYETATWGYIAAGTGAALGAVATYLFFAEHDSAPEPSRAVGITPTHGGVMGALSIRF